MRPGTSRWRCPVEAGAWTERSPFSQSLPVNSNRGLKLCTPSHTGVHTITSSSALQYSSPVRALRRRGRARLSGEDHRISAPRGVLGARAEGEQLAASRDGALLAQPGGLQPERRVWADHEHGARPHHLQGGMDRRRTGPEGRGSGGEVDGGVEQAPPAPSPGPTASRPAPPAPSRARRSRRQTRASPRSVQPRRLRTLTAAMQQLMLRRS